MKYGITTNSSGGFIHEKESRQTIFGYAYNRCARSIAPGRLRRGEQQWQHRQRREGRQRRHSGCYKGAAAPAADTGIDTSKKVELQSIYARRCS